MTDPHDPPPPLDPLDELASAHLDGATTAAEAERIAGDPELQARVRKLQSVRDAVREPVVVDPERRDASIAAALAAFDAGGVGPATVSSLAERRARPDRARRRTVLGIAAAVAAAALLVPALSQLGEDDAEPPTALGEGDDATEDRTAAAPEDAADGAGAGGGSAETELAAPMLEDAEAPGAATAGPPAAVHLGSFAEVDELARTVETQLRGAPAGAADASTPSSDDPVVQECLARRGSDVAPPAVVVLLGTADLDGRPLVVRVVDSPTPAANVRTLTLTDPQAGCREIASRALEP